MPCVNPVSNAMFTMSCSTVATMPFPKALAAGYRIDMVFVLAKLLAQLADMGIEPPWSAGPHPVTGGVP